MKFYFLDTSALVKRYHSEKGTDKIDKIFSQDDRAIIISNITITEMVSAINRKKEDKVISKKDQDIALSKFFHELKVTFVCADKKLVSIAEKEGLQTINPEI